MVKISCIVRYANDKIIVVLTLPASSSEVVDVAESVTTFGAFVLVVVLNCVTFASVLSGTALRGVDSVEDTDVIAVLLVAPVVSLAPMLDVVSIIEVVDFVVKATAVSLVISDVVVKFSTDTVTVALGDVIVAVNAVVFAMFGVVSII